MAKEKKIVEETTKRPRSIAEGMTIDIDHVIDTWNKRNPDLKPMTKIRLAKELKVHPMIFRQWKKQPPYILHCISYLMNLVGCKLEDIFKEKLKEEA